MTKALGEVPEIEEVSPELEDIKKDPLNSVVGDITTQDDPQIKQSASTPNDLWQSWLEKKERWDKEEKESELDLDKLVHATNRHVTEETEGIGTKQVLDEDSAIHSGKVAPPRTYTVTGTGGMRHPKHRTNVDLLHEIKGAPEELWKAWLETRKFQGMGDARYGNQHETGNSDDYMSQQVKDDNVYIGSQDKENKEDDKKDEREDEKVDEKNDKSKQDT
jgi:hypothetical protein